MYNRFQIVMRAFLVFIISLILIMFAIPGITPAAPDITPYLAQLTVDEVMISPAFRPTTLFYTASADQSITALTIHATPQDPTTTVNISGNRELRPGVNTIRIVLTSSKQEMLTYILTVTKAGVVDANSASLRVFSIGTWTLTPVFSPETTSYATDVDQNTSNLNITAVAENSKAQIAISGNTAFRTGQNKVMIEVTSVDRIHTRTYTIMVNKLPAPLKNLTRQEAQKLPKKKFWSPPIILGSLFTVTAISTIVIIRANQKKKVQR